MTRPTDRGHEERKASAGAYEARGRGVLAASEGRIRGEPAQLALRPLERVNRLEASDIPTRRRAEGWSNSSNRNAHGT